MKYWFLPSVRPPLPPPPSFSAEFDLKCLNGIELQIVVYQMRIELPYGDRPGRRQPQQQKNSKMKTTQLTFVRFTLIILQLISLTVASVILIVYYNPWFERMIDEAERTGNTSQTLADQIQHTEGEEIAIFLMSVATILVSIIGIIGVLCGPEHNHCLLNFYMSTLIIFLFVIFVALCGTIWEVFSKLHHSSSINPSATLQQSNSKVLDRSTYLVDDFELTPIAVNRTWSSPSSTTYPLLTDHHQPKPNGPNAQPAVTWWYITKSFIFISLSAALFATSLKLTRRILESSDDRYLSANDVEDDDLNSETSSNGMHYTTSTNSSRHPYQFHYPTNIAGIYNGSMIGSHKGSIGSNFRNIL